MNDHHRTTEQPEFREQSFYQTGSTRPPKSYSGLVSFLLVALILLGSITSALGLLNIRLFQQIRDQSDSSTTPVRFSQSAYGNSGSSGEHAFEPTNANTDTALDIVGTPEAGNLSLGVCGCTVSSFDRMIYRLPQGVYITGVDEASDAAAKGISPGDVLLQLDGTRVTDTDSLKTLLHNYRTGDTVCVVIYRAGNQHTLSVMVGEAKRG